MAARTVLFSFGVNMYIVLVFPFILCVFAASATEKEECFWAIDLVEKDQIEQTVPTLLPRGNYFIRIRVQCDGMINMEMLRSLVLTGVTPVVHTESKYFDVDQYHSHGIIHQLSAALVEMGNNSCGCVKLDRNIHNHSSGQCLCDHTRPTCFQPKGPIIIYDSDCCDVSADSVTYVLHAPAWLVPLPLSKHMLNIHVQIIDTGVGPYIQPIGYNLHVDGFHNVTSGTDTNVLGQESDHLAVIKEAAAINCQLNLSPVCVFGGSHMSNSILYSSSEFATMKVLKISGLIESPSVCSQKLPSSVVIKGTLALPDRILINTPSGLYEVQSNVQGNPDYTGTRVNVLQRCVVELAGPTQSEVRSVVVLAIGDMPDQERVFVATAKQDQQLNFTELRDSDGHNACQFLKVLLQGTDMWSCHIVRGSVSGSSPVLFVILVHTQEAGVARLHLVQFRAVSGSSAAKWTPLFHLPASLDVSAEEAGPEWVMLQSSLSVASASVDLLSLSGVSFVGVVCPSLFLWGTALLYSPDGGSSIHWLTGYLGESAITVFTSSSLHGTYAFLTELQELWIGQIGSPSVRRLNDNAGIWPLTQNLEVPGVDFTIVSVFFDSQGNLQQVPAADIVAHQTFLRKRNENLQASLAARENSSCDSQSEKPRPLTERTCPFAKIRFQAPHGIALHRKCEHRFETSVHLDGNLIQSKSSILSYFTSVERTINQECGGDSKTSSTDRLENKLPAHIYLGRSEKYQFAFYLYLDLDYFVETSWHAWSLDHLHVSFHLSDAGLLNFSAQRVELVQHQAIKYQVVVQDAGNLFQQHPPGERLAPASLHMQVWNSALLCTTHSVSGEQLEGSHFLTFLLGCPAGRKIVFDAEATKAASVKSQFCSDESGVPCFLFERTFLPVFVVVDLVAGHIGQFTGSYTLKVVGGGAELSSVRDYTQEEQETYNYRKSGLSASLIWAAKEKSLGTIPVFNSSTNAISWLCGSRSACGGINPKFPLNAEFYLKLEFSNREVDARSSNCDYTVRFLIRVHGLPPGSLQPSSIIVLSCIGILATVILCLFCLKRKDARLLKVIKRLGSTFFGHVCRKVDVARVRVRRWKNRKTGPGDVVLIQIRKTSPPVAWNAGPTADNTDVGHTITRDNTQLPTHA